MLYYFGNNIETARLKLAQDGRFRLLFRGKAELGDVYEPQVTLSQMTCLLRHLGFNQEVLNSPVSIIVSRDSIPDRWRQAPELCLRSTIPALFRKYGYECDVKESGPDAWILIFSPEHKELLRVACVNYRLA
jgi:hypothetical protein